MISDDYDSDGSEASTPRVPRLVRKYALNPYYCGCTVCYWDHIDDTHKEKKCMNRCVPAGGLEYHLGLRHLPVAGLDGLVCVDCNQWTGCINPDCQIVMLSDGQEYYVPDLNNDEQGPEPLPADWRENFQVVFTRQSTDPDAYEYAIPRPHLVRKENAVPVQLQNA